MKYSVESDGTIDGMAWHLVRMCPNVIVKCCEQMLGLFRPACSAAIQTVLV